MLFDELDILRAEHAVLEDAQEWMWDGLNEQAAEYVNYINGVYDMTAKLLKQLEKTTESADADP